MIQRIQTVYLFIAAILLIVCACLPVGTFYPEGMGSPMAMYNLCILSEDTGMNFAVCGLLCLLGLATVSNIIAIFGYKNRKSQAKQCMMSICLQILWIAYYLVFAYAIGLDNTTFQPSFMCVMPCIAMILTVLARRAIIADEKLVRSVDRIR